jgi:hypothetical protein
MTRPLRLARKWRAATIAAAALVGVGLAAWMGQPSLLANPDAGPAQFADPWEQLYHAKKFDTVAAWEAAVTKAASDEFCQKLARMGLAYHHLLRSRDYEAAEVPLRKLADLQEGDPIKSFGIAGLFVANTQLSRDNDAWTQLSRLKNTEATLTRLRDESPEMYRLYQEAEAELQRRAGMISKDDQ